MAEVYTFEYGLQRYYIPERMMAGVRLYIEHGAPPGRFLTAVICNDLQGAVGQADIENMRNLPAYPAYFYNEAPAECWGSRERMASWIASLRAKETTGH